MVASPPEPEILDICLYLLKYRDLTPLKKEVLIKEWGFKRKCIKVLARTLNVSESYIWHWGTELGFEKIPSAHKATLTALYLQRKMAEQEKIIRSQRKQIRQLERKLSFRSA